MIVSHRPLRGRAALHPRPSVGDIEKRLDAELCAEAQKSPVKWHWNAHQTHLCTHVVVRLASDSDNDRVRLMIKPATGVMNIPAMFKAVPCQHDHREFVGLDTKCLDCQKTLTAADFTEIQSHAVMQWTDLY